MRPWSPFVSRSLRGVLLKLVPNGSFPFADCCHPEAFGKASRAQLGPGHTSLRPATTTGHGNRAWSSATEIANKVCVVRRRERAELHTPALFWS